jgi:hypothetical protein
VRLVRAGTLSATTKTNAQTEISTARQVAVRSKTHRATADVTLFDFPKPIAVCVGLVYFAKRDVHKVVAVDEVSIERFSIF